MMFEVGLQRKGSWSCRLDGYLVSTPLFHPGGWTSTWALGVQGSKHRRCPPNPLARVKDDGVLLAYNFFIFARNHNSLMN